MTPREIVRENIECRCEERIAFNFTGEDRRNDFTGAGCEHDIETKTWTEGNIEYYTDIWGNVWHRIVGLSQGGEVFEPVIKDWADLDNLTLPAIDNPAYFESARKLGASDTDLFRVGSMPGWPFATCRYMRKMEVYFTDLLAHRDRIDLLHDRVTSLFEGVIDRFGEAGMDGIMYCEDLGTQDRLLLGVPIWRDVFRPLYERLTARAHAHGMKVVMHSCGFNYELVDDLCEAGVDCLQFDQPALYDMPALAEKLRRHRAGLFSPCDIQKVLPTGDREIIRRETERLVNTFRGGFIAKNYPDLHGIGVEPEWDRWAYETFVRVGAQEKPR
ncbi:MAG TPA: uroporphyrinogen decarboxylase family protein [Candidatus Hydrogenedentes bacterium]|nr:uroporphyrinogen decarboxylase family protein [Candidatus Hydrogenedentota bacterium]HQM48362.1 uroporphyrinogen decarboxylase family protein [Candidatus Hydrogenedentota bacterium]